MDLGVIIGDNLKNARWRFIGHAIAYDSASDTYHGKPLKMDQEKSGMVVQEYMQQAMERKTAKLQEESKAFLENNKKTEGVNVTASGLQYKVLTAGKGKTPLATDNVTVHYTGKLVDGTVFDSSVSRRAG